MELMGDGLIAFLAAVGVSTILWLLAETLLRRHRPVAEAILVLPVRGDGATLERALRLTMEQRTTGETPILLADCGLDETGLRLAQGLTQRYSRVQLCPAEELEKLSEVRNELWVSAARWREPSNTLSSRMRRTAIRCWAC